jgi:CHAT domain
MVEQTLTQMALELKARNEKFYSDLRDATLASASNPETARAALLRLDTEAISIESFELAFLERMGPEAAAQIPAARSAWAGWRVEILVSLGRAEMLLGHFKEARAALATARALPSVTSDSHGRESIDFIEASINQLDPQPFTAGSLTPQEQFSAAFEDAARRGDWRGAVQAKMQAATAAMTGGNVDAFRTMSREAIDLAAAHSLPRSEIYCRTSRFNFLLRTSTSGSLLDQLKAELDYTTRLTGSLTEYWMETYNRASQACKLASEAWTAATGGNTSPSMAAAWASLPSLLEALSQQASALDLAYLSGRLHDAAVSGSGAGQETASILENFRRELTRVDTEIRSGLLELAAELKVRLNDPQTAEEIRDKAKQLRDAHPVPTVAVVTALADHDDRFVALLEQAGKAIGASNPQQALAYANDAMAIADSPDFRRAAMNYRAMANLEIGRFAEAEADLTESIAMLDSSLADQLPTLAGTRDRRLTELEDLSLLYALLLTKTNRVTEAWNAGERGRAPALKAEIVAAEPESLRGSLSDVSFESLRPWLDSIHAAVVTFSSSRYGTLILTAGPGEAAPQAHIVETTQGQLSRLLAPDFDIGSQAWTSTIFNAVPELSTRLVAPIEQRLLEITRDARILYLVPYSHLFYAPFAACTLSDGRTLAELCPLALTPSVGVLRWAASRSVANVPVSCLAAGVGEDSGYPFSRHTAQVAAAPWAATPALLNDAQVTKAALAQSAATHSVFYLSCHGTFSPTLTDGLAASQLVLANDERLDAREILDWKLPSSLVFLNACQSGRFRFEGRTEPNGFVRAFLLAGARSLISTLVHVDPVSAGNLAQAFFCSYLAGQPAADALRASQLKLKQSGLPAEQWAAHLVTGVGHERAF